MLYDKSASAVITNIKAIFIRGVSNEIMADNMPLHRKNDTICEGLVF